MVFLAESDLEYMMMVETFPKVDREVWEEMIICILHNYVPRPKKKEKKGGAG